VSSFEATTKAEDAWLAELSEKATADLEFLAECTPGYINNEGQNLNEAIYSSTYGPGVFEYLKVLENWRKTDLQSDLELTEE
jgi:cyclohexanone monooxygenase